MKDSFDVLKQMRKKDLKTDNVKFEELELLETDANVDFIPYMKDLQKTIKNNWNPPKYNKNERIVVSFKIRKDGQLLSMKISKSSGRPEADKAALKSIELSAPFKKLPADFNGHSIDINFKFDYNILNRQQDKNLAAPKENKNKFNISKQEEFVGETHNNINFIFHIAVGLLCIFMGWQFLYHFLMSYNSSDDASTISNIIIGIIVFWYYYNNPFLIKNKQLEAKVVKLESDLFLKDKDIESYIKYSKNLKMQNDFLINNISAGMDYLSDFIADNKTLNYELSESILKNKKRPAIMEAQRIASLRKETREYIKEYKLMRYEYEYLFTVFPELENYIDFYGQDKNDEITLKEVKDNYDYVKKWVSNEDYLKLSENQRNQLALDNYVASRKKNKWQIGRDYEMFIGHEYEKQGYKVEYTGIIKRIEDLGRDLIAKKENEILIVQCKNWSKYKEIHENHICQLFGTVIQYNIENNQKAIPVFVTTTGLSETAIKFAKYLGIKIIQNKQFEDFPRIKCNINNGEKIYHLPFDQQYDRTIIDKEGEFFAWTVQEAVDKGFRRAKKYFFTNLE